MLVDILYGAQIVFVALVWNRVIPSPDFSATQLGLTLAPGSFALVTINLLYAASGACGLVQLIELSLEWAFKTETCLVSFERPTTAVIAFIPLIFVAASLTGRESILPFAFATTTNLQMSAYTYVCSKLFREAYPEEFSTRLSDLSDVLECLALLIVTFALVLPQVSFQLNIVGMAALGSRITIFATLVRRVIYKRGLVVDWTAHDTALFAALYLYAYTIYVTALLSAGFPALTSLEIWMGMTPWMAMSFALINTLFTFFVTSFSRTAVTGNRLRQVSLEHEARLQHLLAAEKREMELVKAAVIEEAKSQSLIKERELTLRLLYSVMPAKIANDLSNGREVMPQVYDFAVVFFSDIKGFTAFSAINSSLAVFAMLDRHFAVMDHCCALFPTLYKVETAGDSFMVVGGLGNKEDDEDVDGANNNDGDGGSSSSNDPSKSCHSFQVLVDLLPNKSEHDARNLIVSNAMCQFALLVRDQVQKVRMDETSFISIRIGIHCGPITTGLSGRLTPHYCLFGDTINTSARMEQSGETGKVHISAALKSMLKHSPLSEGYLFEKRVPVEIKGKGCLQTYFLESSCKKQFRKKFAAEISEIDKLIASLHMGTFSVQGGKVVRVASVLSLDSDVPADHTTNVTMKRQMSMNKLFGAAYPDVGEGIKEISKKNSFNYPLSRDLALQAAKRQARSSNRRGDADDDEMDNQGGREEVKSPSSSYGSIGRRQNSNDALTSLLTWEMMLSDNFSVLSIDVDDFTAIQAAIVELMRSVVGDFEGIQVDETVLQHFTRRVGTLYRETPYHNFHHSFW